MKDTARWSCVLLTELLDANEATYYVTFYAPTHQVLPPTAPVQMGLDFSGWG